METNFSYQFFITLFTALFTISFHRYNEKRRSEVGWRGGAGEITNFMKILGKSLSSFDYYKKLPKKNLPF